MKTQELQEMWDSMTQEARDLEIALLGIESYQKAINRFDRDYQNCRSDEARGKVIDQHNLNWLCLESEYKVIARSVL